MPFRMNPLFVGRETDLKILAVALKGGETVAVGQIAAATGLGGIGKTQLAVALVHHYGQYFVGGVHWLSFADPNAIPAEIAMCGKMMLNLHPDFGTLDLESQIHLVLAAWQSPLPRLLVFDNCEDPNLLARWRPPSGGSRILITSRRPNWDATLGVQPHSLSTLSRQQSIMLLHKFPATQNALPFTPEDEPSLNGIADELGDLPLALHLASNYLARYRREVSPTAYLAQLRQPDLLQHRSLQVGDRSPTDHEQHVARTFALSYERLTAADALARALLARAACFAPSQLIPRALLLASIEPDHEPDHEGDMLQAADALQQLVNLGLLEVEANGDILMHRLVVHFVNSINRAMTQAAQSAVAAALQKEANRINNTALPGPLLEWQTHLRHITDAVKDRNDEQAARLCNALGFHLVMIGDYAAAKPYYEQALAIREAVLGKQHPDTASSYNNLASLLKDTGDYAAAKSYLEQALAIFEAVLGPTHPSTKVVRANLLSIQEKNS